MRILYLAVVICLLIGCKKQPTPGDPKNYRASSEPNIAGIWAPAETSSGGMAWGIIFDSKGRGAIFTLIPAPFEYSQSEGKIRLDLSKLAKATKSSNQFGNQDHIDCSYSFEPKAGPMGQDKLTIQSLQLSTSDKPTIFYRDGSVAQADETMDRIWNTIYNKDGSIRNLANNSADQTPSTPTSSANDNPDARNSAQCRTNIDQLTRGMLLYASDYNDVLPPAQNWQTLLQPYVKATQVFNCPSLSATGQSGYGYLESLAGQTLAAISGPSTTPFIFESIDLTPSAHGQEGSILSTPRHNKEIWIGYADGKVRAK